MTTNERVEVEISEGSRRAARNAESGLSRWRTGTECVEYQEGYPSSIDEAKQRKDALKQECSAIEKKLRRCRSRNSSNRKDLVCHLQENEREREKLDRYFNVFGSHKVNTIQDDPVVIESEIFSRLAETWKKRRTGFLDDPSIVTNNDWRQLDTLRDNLFHQITIKKLQMEDGDK